MSICFTNKNKDCIIINWLHPSHKVKESVIKWTIVPWVMVKCINIKIVYLTANTKHTRLVARTLQLALTERAESFTNIKSHTLGTRCGVPQPLFGCNFLGSPIQRSGQKYLHCAMVFALCNGICTVQWHLHCGMAFALCNGMCTVQWHLHCAMAFALCNGICTVQWYLHSTRGEMVLTLGEASVIKN